MKKDDFKIGDLVKVVLQGTIGESFYGKLGIVIGKELGFYQYNAVVLVSGDQCIHQYSHKDSLKKIN